MALPSDISGLVCWLKAGVGVYTDAGTTRAGHNDLVYQWNDQSGAGNHAVQATSGSRPKLNTLDGYDGYVECCLATGENQRPFMTLDNVTFGTQAMSMFVISTPLTLRGKVSGEDGIRTLAKAVSGSWEFGYCHETAYGNNTLRTLAINNGAWRNGSSLVPTSPCLLGVVGSAASCRYIVNESTDTIAALGSATITGLSLFGQSGFDRSFWGGVQEVIIYDRAVTDQELADIRAYAATRGAVYASATRNVLLFIGDSITTGQVAALNRNYQRFLRPLIPPCLEYTVAKGSASLSGMTTDQASYYNPYLTAGKRCVVSIFAGSADIGAGATGATAFSRLTTLAANLYTAGFDKVCVTKMLPRAAQFDAARDAYNGAMTSDGLTSFDALSEWGNDSNMGQAGQHTSDTYYYSDDLHPNATGHQVGAGHLATALAPLLLVHGGLR